MLRFVCLVLALVTGCTFETVNEGDDMGRELETIAVTGGTTKVGLTGTGLDGGSLKNRVFRARAEGSQQIAVQLSAELTTAGSSPFLLTVVADVFWQGENGVHSAIVDIGPTGTTFVLTAAEIVEVNARIALLTDPFSDMSLAAFGGVVNSQWTVNGTASIAGAGSAPAYLTQVLAIPATAGGIVTPSNTVPVPQWAKYLRVAENTNAEASATPGETSPTLLPNLTATFRSSSVAAGTIIDVQDWSAEHPFHVPGNAYGLAMNVFPIATLFDVNLVWEMHL